MQVFEKHVFLVITSAQIQLHMEGNEKVQLYSSPSKAICEFNNTPFCAFYIFFCINILRFFETGAQVFFYVMTSNFALEEEISRITREQNLIFQV